jgi:lipid-A-disaccharide synthase
MAKILVKIELIGLVNILAEKEVVEEFVQADAEPVAVSRALLELLESPEKRENLCLQLAETTSKLGGPGAHQRAANAVAVWLHTS